MASVGGVKSGGLPQKQAFEKGGTTGMKKPSVPMPKGGVKGGGGMSVKGAGRAVASQSKARCD